METDITLLILHEVRALRSDVANHAIAIGERLSALETVMKSLVGREQPGRITNLEIEVKDLGALRRTMLGIWIGREQSDQRGKVFYFRH